MSLPGGSQSKIFSHAQLMTLWTSNGGSASTADVAAAVAQCESSGNSGAQSRNPDGGTNVGLWQLDTKGKGAGHTVAELPNPATNAAVTVSATGDGGDWSAWACFASGAYKSHLSGQLPGSSSAPAVQSPATGLAAIGDFLARLADPHLWLRVLETGLGIVLLAVGLAHITRAVPLATKIATTAGAGALAR